MYTGIKSEIRKIEITLRLIFFALCFMSGLLFSILINKS